MNKAPSLVAVSTVAFSGCQHGHPEFLPTAPITSAFMSGCVMGDIVTAGNHSGAAAIEEYGEYHQQG